MGQGGEKAGRVRGKEWPVLEAAPNIDALSETTAAQPVFGGGVRLHVRVNGANASAS